MYNHSDKVNFLRSINAWHPHLRADQSFNQLLLASSERYQPGIGLPPGGERPDLEPLIVTLYRAMYEAIATHSRLGLNVVADVGHHDAYSFSAPRGHVIFAFIKM